MKLRRLLMVFVAVLLISLAAVITVSADEGQFEIAVGVSSSTAIFKDGLYNVKPGDEIELTVSINENPGIDSFQINIKYDPELLTPVLVADADKIAVDGILLPNCDVSLQSPGLITFNRFSRLSGDNTTTATGKATIKFIVNDVICKSIKFELGTLSAVKSVEGSIFPKDYIKNEHKQAITTTLNNSVFAAHAFELVETTAPTCTEYGILHYSCTNCNETFEGVGDDPIGHTPVREDDKNPTCSEPGYLGATYCSVCSEVLYERTELSTIEHHVVSVKGQAATCISEGLTDGKQCSVCQTWIEEQTVIPFADHTLVDVQGKPATCTKDGLTDGKKCSVCDAVIDKQEVIPAAHGKIEIVKGREPTENEGGLTDGKKCSVCGVIVETQQPIAKLAKETGCGGVINVGAIAIIVTAIAGACVFKKKEH